MALFKLAFLLLTIRMCSAECTLNCASPKTLNQTMCACVCPTIPCPAGQTLDLTTCVCACVSLACSAQQTFDQATCACKCLPVMCPAGQTQNSTTCVCACVPPTCTAQQTFDQATCTCKCSQQITCSSIGQTQSSTTCACVTETQLWIGTPPAYSTPLEGYLTHVCDADSKPEQNYCYYKSSYVANYALQQATNLQRQAESCLIYKDVKEKTQCARCKREITTVSRTVAGKYDQLKIECSIQIKPQYTKAYSYSGGQRYTWNTVTLKYDKDAAGFVCFVPMQFEVYQDLVRTITPEGTGCSHVNQNNIRFDSDGTWPPKYVSPGMISDSYSTGNVWDVQYIYIGLEKDAIASTVGVSRPTSYESFACTLTPYDYTYGKFIQYPTTEFTYTVRQNYISSVQEPLCIKPSQFLTPNGTAKTCLNTNLPRENLNSLETNQKLALFQSIGCQECNPNGYYPSITFKSAPGIFQYDCLPKPSNYGNVTGLGCENPLFVYDWAGYTEQTKKVQCVECTKLIPNCVICSNASTCSMCQTKFTPNVVVDGFNVSHSVCLYQFCGIKNMMPSCELKCTLSGCQKCETIKSLGFIESCKTCLPGYYPQSIAKPYSTQSVGNGGTQPVPITKWDYYTKCLPQTGVMQYDVFVKSTNQAFFTTVELSQIKTNTGTRLDSPYWFINGVFSDAYVDKQFKTQNQFTTKEDIPDGIFSTLPTNLFIYQSVTVNVWLFKGVHHLFQCFDQKTMSADFLPYVTNLCDPIKIEQRNLRIQPTSDAIKFNFKPMLCSERLKYFVQLDRFGSAYDFNNNCVDFENGAQKPQIRIMSPYTIFNITHTMTFENIEFTGQDLLFKTKSSKVFTSQIPVTKCSILTTPDGRLLNLNMTQIVGFPNFMQVSCEQPINFTAIQPTQKIDNACWPDTSTAFKSRRGCHGDVQSKEYFTYPTENFKYRHSTLFNLYSFDALRSDRRHTPSLNLTNCEFRYFLGNMSSLIQVETNNFGVGGIEMTDGVYDSKQKDFAFPFFFGEDRGARIAINTTLFEHSSFCKGLIIYSQTQTMSYTSNKLLFNMTANMNNNLPNSADRQSSFILISNSTFVNLGFAQQLTHIGMLQYPTDDSGVMYDGKVSILQYIPWPVFFHQGLVLNVQGFGGVVEVRDSNFQKNMIYIPETYISKYNANTYIWPTLNDIQFSNFCKVRQQELALKWCDTTYNGTYFFNDFINPNVEFDDEKLSQIFETNSIITIQYPSKPTIFVNNRFTNNIGTFGIINIYTPIFYQNPSQPALILQGNVFKQNMAYFAGNAFYVSLKLKMVKEGIDVTQTCGSQILITDNTFSNNIGMKRHNGGAGVIHCALDTLNDNNLRSNGNYLKRLQMNTTTLEYAQALNITYTDIKNPYYGGPYDDPTLNTTLLNSTLVPREQYKVLTYGTLIQNNKFSGNMAGMRGTALFITSINELQLLNNDFTFNGPASVFQEIYYSPFYQFLANGNKTLLYYDSIDHKCVSEFDYFHKCAQENFEIDMPSIQGAVHIVNCNNNIRCYTTLNDYLKRQSSLSKSGTKDFDEFSRRFIAREMPHQKVTISNNYFFSNNANIVLNKSQNLKQSSSLYIVGGSQNIINKNRFNSHKGPFSPWMFNYAYDLYSYMPKDYFMYSQAPVIRIVYNYDQFVEARMNQTNSFSSNEFTDNYNFQVLSFEKLQYMGALIEFESQMSNVTFNFTLNQVKQNQITGSNCALIGLTGGLANIYKNIFSYNGLLTNDTHNANPNDQYREFRLNYFPYESFVLEQAQDMGIFYFNFMWFDVPEKMGHFIQNNIFEYNFCMTGCAFAVGGTKIQQFFFSDNVYQFMIAKYSGSVFDGSRLNLPDSDEYSQLWIQQYRNERISNTFGGAINLDNANNLPITIIQNTDFLMNFGQKGAAISMTQGGGLFIQNCTFKMDPRLGASKQGPLLLQEMIQMDLLNSNTTAEVVPESQDPMLLSSDLFKINYRDTRPMSFLVSDDYLIQQLDEIQNQDGQIYLKNSKLSIINVGQPLIGHNFQQLQQFLTDKFVKDINGIFQGYSMALDCVFQYLWGIKSSAISIYDSWLGLTATGEPRAQKNLFLNRSTNGTTIYASYSRLATINIYMDNNQALQGGCIQLDNSKMYSNSSVFEKNWAKEGGVIFAIQKSSCDVQNSTLAENYAEDGSVLYGMASNAKGALNFNDCLFTNNYQKANLINLLLSDLVVSNSTFSDNFSQQVTHGITMITSNLLVANTTIQNYKVMPAKLFDKSKVDTGFFNLYLGSSLELCNNTVIRNLTAQNCAVLSAISQSNVHIHDQVSFIGTKALIIDGAASLCFINTNLTNVQQAYFENNSQANIKIANGNLLVKDSNFTQMNDEYSMITGSESSINLINVYVYNSSSYKSHGHAFLCQYCYEVNVINSTFENLISQKGGALSIENLQRTGAIINNTFRKNVALQSGGAINLEEPRFINIFNNTFVSNKVTAATRPVEVDAIIHNMMNAGAIWYSCKPGNQCDVNLVYNSFVGNEADNKGGALLWVNKNVTTGVMLPQLGRRQLEAQDNITAIGIQGFEMCTIAEANCTADTNTYLDNKANYGGKVGNFPAKIIFTLTDPSEIGASISEEGMKLNLAPGQQFNLTITIFDNDGLIYNDESSAVASIDFIQTTDLDKNSVVLGRQVVAKNGRFNFPTLTLRLTPDSKAKVKLLITDLQVYNNNITFINIPPIIDVTARACVEGEYYDLFLSCIPCAPGFYSYVKQTSVGICTSCEAEANCYGKNITSPKDGYWRSNATSVNWLNCPNKDACRSGDYTHPLGICKKGYTGILCTDCKYGYRKSGFECQVCPSLSKNLTLLIGLIIVMLLFVAILVRSTINSVALTKPLYSVFYKIAMNHFQLLAQISSIKFPWPPTIQVILNSQKSIADAPAQALSTDCIQQLLFTKSEELFQNSLRTINANTIAYACMPIIIFILCFIFWRVYGFIAKLDKGDIQDKTLATQVIILFLFYPTIVGALADSVNCITIEGEKRLFKDMTQICWKGQHRLVFLCATLPGMILWAIGIPLYALFKLKSNKETLRIMSERSAQGEEGSTKELQKRFNIRLGFLKAGFEEKQYYWEVVLLMRKTIIVMMITFLAPVSSGVQSLTVILVLVIFYYLQLRLKPYYADSLNQMEWISLIVLIVTIYAGLYYQAGQNDVAIMKSAVVQWLIFIMVLVPSLMFMFYFLYNMRIEVFKVLIKKNQRVFRFITCGIVDIQKFREQHMKEEIVGNQQQLSEDSDKLDKEINENAFGFQQMQDLSVTVLHGNLTDMTGHYEPDEDVVDPEDIDYLPKIKRDAFQGQNKFQRKNTPRLISRDESEGGTPASVTEQIDTRKRDRSARLIHVDDYRDQIQFQGEDNGQRTFMQQMQKHPDDDILEENPITLFTNRSQISNNRSGYDKDSGNPYNNSRSMSKVFPESVLKNPAKNAVRNNFVSRNEVHSSSETSEIYSTFGGDAQNLPMQVIQTDVNNSSSQDNESSFERRRALEEESGESDKFQGTFGRKRQEATENDQKESPSSSFQDSDVHLSTERMDDLAIQTDQSVQESEKYQVACGANDRVKKLQPAKKEAKKQQILSSDSSSEGDRRMHPSDRADSKKIKQLVGYNSKSNQRKMSPTKKPNIPKVQMMGRAPKGKNSDYSMSDSHLSEDEKVHSLEKRSQQTKPGHIVKSQHRRQQSEVIIYNQRATANSSEGAHGAMTQGTGKGTNQVKNSTDNSIDLL